MAGAREERAREIEARQNHDWIDERIAELEPLAADARALVVLSRLQRTAEQHGPGPYPAEDLAVFADTDLDAVQRVLETLVEAGIATDDGE